MLEADDDFKKMVEANKWHDRSEIDEFVKVIKELSLEPEWTDDGNYALGSNRWSWARNMRCKYVSLHFDMRDGGFTLLARGGDRGSNERISLDHLRWQHDSEKDDKEGKTRGD